MEGLARLRDWTRMLGGPKIVQWVLRSNNW